MSVYSISMCVYTTRTYGIEEPFTEMFIFLYMSPHTSARLKSLLGAQVRFGGRDTTRK